MVITITSLLLAPCEMLLFPIFVTVWKIPCNRLRLQVRSEDITEISTVGLAINRPKLLNIITVYVMTLCSITMQPRICVPTIPDYVKFSS